MFPRLVVLAFILASPALRAQEVLSSQLPAETRTSAAAAESAWLDLRQSPVANSKAQTAPAWIEAVSLASPEAKPGQAGRTVFRIRVSRPRPDSQVLLFRLFFDDKPEAQPTLIAWDESGTQVLRSSPLGAGVDLPTSETVMIPMNGASTIDIEVPGDGKTVRGAYMDWMTSSEVLHPVNVEHRDLIPEPFSAATPLHAPAQDVERFGTVTATLADETIRIGASVQNGAAFQFGIESQPLAALLTFEVASPDVGAPPEIYVNGQSVGSVSLTLPELSDPGYRGEMGALAREMRFQYTGWIRAQKLIPVSYLRAGSNDVLVTAGGGTAVSAIRATQVQLKYLWDKSDYQLVPGR